MHGGSPQTSPQSKLLIGSPPRPPLAEGRGVPIASVGGGMAPHLGGACGGWFPVAGLKISDATSSLPITLAVDEPLPAGAARIINTPVASRHYARDAVVVDLG